MAEFVPELLPGQTAEHLVGGVGVAGAAREMATRFTGRRGEEAAPVTAGKRSSRRRPRNGLQCQLEGASDCVDHTFAGRPQEEGMKQCSSSFPQYETKV